VNDGHRPGYARGVAGQTELTSQQRRSLAGDGYLLVTEVLAAGAVEALAGRLDDLARATIAEWDAAPGEQPEEAGVVRLRLDPADPSFAPCVRHPLLFAAAGAAAWLRPPGSASRLLPWSPHQRPLAGPGRDVVHYGIHFR
jgi:hypothetical protein